jgi:predicted MFS family arabinose efflux permease
MMLAILWLIAFLNYVDRQALFSVLPSIRSELGATDAQIGLFGTVFLWTYGICSPLAGIWGDRWQRRTMILWSLALFSAATLLTGWAAGAAALILLRAGLGVSEAMYLPAANALIAASHAPGNRSKAIGIHLSGLNVGAIAGGTLAGYMADHYGWRSAFLLLGIVGWILAVICRFILREPSRGPQKALRGSLRGALPEILSRKTVLVILFSGLSASMAGWVLMSWLPLHLYEKFHLSMARAAFDGTFYFLGSTAAGTVLGSVISDGWSGRRRDARLRLQAFGLAIFGPALLAASGTASEVALLSWLCVAGVGRGFWDCNNMPVFCEVLEADRWSGAYGIFNMANVFGGGLAVFLAGWLRASLGLNAMLAIYSALLMVAAALSWLSVYRFFPREKRD